jgi:hypothetical protein
VTAAGRWEKIFLGLSASLFAAGLLLSFRTGEALDWTKARMFFPAGLWAMAAANVKIRSKVLAWGIFTFSFVFFMIVFGPWVVGLRTVATVETIKFMRAMATFLCLAVTGLFQLRAARGG